MSEHDSRSAPIRLLHTVWAGANRAAGHSWERLNHSMSNALELAIGSGMEFEPGDFGHIQKEFRSGYWAHWENVYELAICVGNKSAVAVFEADFNRPPFICDAVRVGGSSEYQHGGGGERQRERLALGFEFPWKGEKVKVTSFAADSKSLNACSYRREPADYEHCATCGHVTVYPKEVLLHRYTITPADIKADRAKRTERAKLEKMLADHPAGLQILAEIGIKTNEQFSAAALETIREAAAKLPYPAKETSEGRSGPC